MFLTPSWCELAIETETQQTGSSFLMHPLSPYFHNRCLRYILKNAERYQSERRRGKFLEFNFQLLLGSFLATSPFTSIEFVPFPFVRFLLSCQVVPCFFVSEKVM